MTGKTTTTAMKAESGCHNLFGMIATSVAAIPLAAKAAAGESP